jgi:thiamine-monophosphate kinase
VSQTVRDLGEFGLIEALRGVLSPEVVAGPSLRVGIGDDSAIWAPTAGESLVITTDSLVEGVHFRLDWTDWRSLGHKSLAVNLSDLAAMGANPRLAFVSLGLTGDELVEDIQEMYRGIDALAAPHGVLIAGGDIVSSRSGVMIHVTAMGETHSGRALRRSGAQPGDLICVSGTIGASAAGFHLLMEGADGPRAGSTTAELLIAAHLRPQPRIALGKLLVELGATSAMDLSDGLYGDLPKILEMSGVSGKIELAKLPVASAVRALFPDEWVEFATRGGEDYELLFTLPPDQFEQLRSSAESIEATIAVIGIITEASDDNSSLIVVDFNGNEVTAELGAFDHFREIQGDQR